MMRLSAMKRWARLLKRDVFAVWIAARDPRVPLRVKCVAGVVAAYALSPVDLIPDFIPILGYLDDLILVPLGIMLVIRLVPAALMEEFRLKASRQADRPVSRAGLAVILVIWITCIIFVGWTARDLFSSRHQATSGAPA